MIRIFVGFLGTVPKRLGKNGWIRNQRKNSDYIDNNIIEIGLNTEKSPEHLGAIWMVPKGLGKTRWIRNQRRNWDYILLRSTRILSPEHLGRRLDSSEKPPVKTDKKNSTSFQMCNSCQLYSKSLLTKRLKKKKNGKTKQNNEINTFGTSS